MAHVFKKPLIPLAIVIILLALYFTRWEKKVTIKPNVAVQSIYKTDRWTGQRWVMTYRSNEVWEEPTLDNYAVSVYVESVKQRPDVIKEREEKISEVNKRMENFQPQVSTYIDIITHQKKQFVLATKEWELNIQLNRVENEINQLAVETAKTELGNKAWVKRKYFSWAWDGLFALSSLWLLVSLLLRNKKAGAV